MAHRTLLIAFCLLPQVIALQTSANQNDAPHSFVSKNKLFCAQASESIANDALKLFKSMPRGKLFDGTMLNLLKSCSDLGYKSSSGEDPCYPGLHTFYRNKEEGEHFYKELQNHLLEYGNRHNMTLEDANFQDTCLCHGRSYAKKNIKLWYSKSCDANSNRPHSFVSKNKLFCAQASESITTDAALKLFKSMPRGKLFDGSMVNLHKSCADLGYKSSAGEDPCYPGLHTFYRNREEGDHFYKELQNHLNEFGGRHNVTLDDANRMDTCKCHEKSYAKNNVGLWFKKSCDSSN